MRIGSEFQAKIPDLSEFQNTADASQGSGSILVWTPNAYVKEDDRKKMQKYRHTYIYMLMHTYMYTGSVYMLIHMYTCNLC